MRIAILTNSYPPQARGGSGRIAELQADWLSSKGNEVCVWVPAPFSDIPKNTQIKSFKTQTATPFAKLSDQNPLSRLAFHIEDLSPNADLVEDIRNFKPDVLLTHNLTGCGWGTPSTLMKAGIRWVHILHDVQMVEPSGQVTFQESMPRVRSIWRKYWSKKRRRAFGSPNVIISPSSWLLVFHKQFNLFNDTKTAVIPNPIQTSNVKHNSPHVEPIVLYVGRVSKDKGAEVLVNAWQLLSPQSQVPNPKSNISLKIIGDGPYLKEIKNLNDPSIECLGALNHSDLAKHYNEASLFIFPSLLMENQPTVLLEAMSHGLNIIASNIGGVGELLGGYGTLVPPGNAEKLAQAITEQLDKTPDSNLGQEILSHHEINKVMEEYLKIISR